MASNAEMRRLILHAADRLAEEDPDPAFEQLVREVVGVSAQIKWQRALVSLTAAMALAEQTLRMVAACLADDEPNAEGCETK